MEKCQLKTFGDERGKLVVLENLKDLPFEMKRIFYIYDSDKSVVRGQHANRNSKFAFICLSGSVSIKAHDGKEEFNFELNQPDEILVLDKMIWKDMYNFSKNAILLVISDCVYDEHEYIRNFDDFLKECPLYE